MFMRNIQKRQKYHAGQSREQCRCMLEMPIPRIRCRVVTRKSEEALSSQPHVMGITASSSKRPSGEIRHPTINAGGYQLQQASAWSNSSHKSFVLGLDAFMIAQPSRDRVNALFPCLSRHTFRGSSMSLKISVAHIIWLDGHMQIVGLGSKYHGCIGN
ncbi:hypothetical protein BDN70DRAFT_877148 [Pholiota conissans]|uniref:Uncharacterized protein n=1 Tax=Pholiota conissans TaxID=109636 RepID=A0A9P5Z6B0_9AGAR|nr:hypothetical protein BDN70DRAFT_877148 [Pholiota conissans]